MITDHRSFTLSGRPTFERLRGTPPLRVPVRMPNEACFYYILEGDSRTFTPQGRIEQPAREGLVLQCGNYVTEFLASSQGTAFSAIAIHLYPQTLRLIYDQDFPRFLEEVDRVRPVAYRRVAATALLTNYVASLQFYFDNPELVSDELQQLKIRELLLLLARTDKASAVRALVEGLFHVERADFRAVIEVNLYEPLTTGELALLCGMSLSTFKRTFARTYRQPPAHYIRQRRLAQAADLLRRTQRRVSEIAYDCGFRELAHFSRSFRQAYGQSPSAYRRQ